MILDYLLLAGLVIIIISLLLIIASENWRVIILLLSIQYLGSFFVLLKSLPIVIASAKLIAGWIAGVILGMAITGLSSEEQKNFEQSDLSEAKGMGSHRIFNMLIAGMAVLVIISIVGGIQDFIPGIDFEQSLAASLLIGFSLIQLSINSQPFKVVVSLLFILTGFEILYTVVETSALVIGLLTVVDLGLALVGAYLIQIPTMEQRI